MTKSKEEAECARHSSIRITEALQKQGMTQKMPAGRIDIAKTVMPEYISESREPKPEAPANRSSSLNATYDILLLD